MLPTKVERTEGETSGNLPRLVASTRGSSSDPSKATVSTSSQGKKKNRKPKKRCEDRLPVHVARSFETELINLVLDLEDPFWGTSYLKSEFLSKYRDPKRTTPKQRRDAAIEKWLRQEEINRVTNTRLFLAEEDFGWCTSQDFIVFVRKLIAKVLGPLQYPTILFGGGTHTNGASTRIRRGVAAAVAKHSGKAHVSSTALNHWRVVAESTVLQDQGVSIQESSVLFTVPKSSDIDRVACKEPEANMFMQRMIGNHIRQRLRRFGVNLNDQSRNQMLAQEALDRRLATIDLSSASDSITDSLVRLLLPFEWYSLLDDLRVKKTQINGKEHDLEMFSSMGNGFTFELESLLFWALTRAVAKFSRVSGTISVYGDDIICPIAIARRVARIFSWFGFKVNAKKSYWSGWFRESCGRHFYLRYEVTPFYLREPVRRKTDVIRLLNHLLAWDGRGWGFFQTEEIARFHAKWARAIPEELWGGVNPSDNSSLVTGHLPRKRLVPVLKNPVEFDQDAALAYWLTATAARLHEPRCLVAKATGIDELLRYLSSEGISGDDSLEVDPRLVDRYIISDTPSYFGRTTWDPYFLFRDMGLTL